MEAKFKIEDTGWGKPKNIPSGSLDWAKIWTGRVTRVKDSIGEPTLSLAARSSEERKTNARGPLGVPLKETIVHRSVKGIRFL